MSKEPALLLYERIEASSKLADRASQVRDIRVILESMFKMLTRSETRSFSNLYGRMEYIFDKMQVQQYMQDQLHGLRQFSNKLSHNDLDPSLEDGMRSIRAIAEGVEYFYEKKVPADIVAIYHPLGDKRFQQSKPQVREQVEQMKPVVLSIGAVEPTTKDGAYFIIKCREESLGEFELQLWKNTFNDLSSLQPFLRPFDTLQVLNCRKHPTKQNFYTSGNETQVILEPDILIDISDLAECFQSNGAYPILALLKKLVPQSFAQPAFQGNVVNTILDSTLRESQPDLKIAFKEAVADNIFLAAVYGKHILNDIFKEINSKHWKNLVSVANQYKGKPIRIEPTFLSSIYGLQGRLDLLVEDENDATFKEIVELKSGKAPDGDPWRNNEMQVGGYNLLLKSTFGSNRHGPSSIFYSAAENEPLRNIVSNDINENKLLMVRNELVYYLLQLAQGNMGFLSTINSATLQDLPSFKLVDIGMFEKVYRDAGNLEKTYYHHFLCFIIRQWLHEKCGMYSNPDRLDDGDGFAALWKQDEIEKKQQYTIITDLKFQSFTSEDSTVLFSMEDPDQQHNFRPGDTAILYHRIAENATAINQQIIKGRVDRLNGGEVVFSLNNRQLDGSYFSQPGAVWLVEHDIFESNTWVACRSLLAVLNPANKEKFQLLMGLKAPGLGNLKEALGYINNDGLNENQVQVITKALAAKDYFLVQGPPGTGKTSTLLPQLIKGLLAKEKGSIMVVAFTNRAVEEIATRLKQQEVEYLRFGGRGSEAEKELRQYCTDGNIDAAREYIQSKRVFLATVTTMCSRLDSLKQLKDDLHTLIVDEASQLTEPQLLGLLMDRKKFILIGDQNQLPPVVAIHEAFCQVEDAEMRAAGIADLRTALFERLFRRARQQHWDHSIDMLNTHFRMHDDIAHLINPWYGNQLRSGKAEQQTAIDEQWDATIDESEDRWHEVLQKGRVIYIPSAREPLSKHHFQEARRVVTLLKYLKKKYASDFVPEKVGVITPWRTQIALIRNLIGKDTEIQGLNIDTVERFQGSENEIIIVSMAVFHPSQISMITSIGKFPHIDEHGQLSDIEVDRKLLVTISRAKKQVIILGYDFALRSSKYYSMLLI
ncbi:AAA domain-containing protein [Flavihumibacter sediminis]|nr:AAA domain-containing protein [Flavihumibacter sediminis]